MSAKYRKQKSGLYRTKVWDGTYKDDGTPHYVWLSSGKSSVDLERKVRAFRDKLESRQSYTESGKTFHDYAVWWLKVYKGGKSANTRSMYEWAVNTHLARADVRLSDFDVADMFAILEPLSKKPNAKKKVLLTIRQVIKAAVAAKCYPALKADELYKAMPSVPYQPKEKRPLTENELKAVFKAQFRPMDKAFVFCLYGFGLRREEALALTKDDFDFKAHTLSVSKALTFVKGQPVEKETKTYRSVRVLPIPDSVYPYLSSYVGLLASGEKLFRLKSGKVFTLSGYIRMWERVLKAMNEAADEPIDGLTAHIFRHNYTTALCSQIPQLSIKNVARLVGDTESVVMRVYAHVQMERENTQASVSKALSPASPGDSRTGNG